MNKSELNQYLGTADLSVIEALEKIEKNARGILYIADEKGCLVGSLTDGDIRRWLLKTGDLSGTVGQMAYKNTKYLFEADSDRHTEYMKSESIRSVPIVDAGMKIVNIFFRNGFSDVWKKKRFTALSGMPIIVMAGGKGTRLQPYTKILPKPLIPVGDIPILERILNRFHQYGAGEFYLTINYKKEMIKSYFAEQKPPYIIHYVEEEEPLGTAGSIHLIDEVFDKPVIVTNCDILIEIDYEKMIEHHKASGNDMTIVSSLKNTLIPYGVLHSQEKGIITSMEEKPQLSYFINTGMYVVNPDYLRWIPKDRVFHMTDLAGKMMAGGKQVGMYPISGNAFLDMGEFEEMKKMEDRISRGLIE